MISNELSLYNFLQDIRFASQLDWYSDVYVLEESLHAMVSVDVLHVQPYRYFHRPLHRRYKDCRL